jgi:L,D-transpeptidase YcbB
MARAASLALRVAVFALWLCGSAAMAQADDTLLWFEAQRPTAQARQAVALLAAADSHGLEPGDYRADALAHAVQQAADAGEPDMQQLAALDRALSEAMQRFLLDLHAGRVDPRQIHHNFSAVRRAPFDAAAVLREALAQGRLADAVQAAAPPIPLYEWLREALARYRTLADHAAWQEPLAPLPGSRRGSAGELEPGVAYNGTLLLARRLAALGDLALDAPPPLRYEEPLVSAVMSFQRRHALVADGVIGRATLTQLQVPPAVRSRQIELALERLRWTPLMQGPRMVVINVPEFVLRAYEVQDGRIRVRHEMKVIVGKTPDTRTPLFDEDMRFIEFSPYWNVPASIARNELVPRLRRDPGYYTREGFEFVAGDGSVDTTLSAVNLNAVLDGGQRIRQRPGPHNALGTIKFVFPNRAHIFLHDTPGKPLFERSRRDFSHGCIRVEQPLALATFVMRGMPAWTEERIRDAMAAGQSSTVALAEPVPVLIAYGTALVKDGRVHFFDDLYGYDRLLDDALRRQSALRARPG